MERASIQHPRRARCAFSLIEVLVVMAVIGLLAGLITGLSGRARAKARVAATQAQIEKVKLGLEEYKLEYGRYPRVDSARALVAALYAIPKSRLQPVFVEFDPSELEETNLWKDAWGNEFIYDGRTPTHHPDSYDLYSTGPNGQDGDEDDITR